MGEIQPTFRDEESEAVLREQGWKVVPLLDEDQTRALRDFYREHSKSGKHNPAGAYDPTYAEFSVVHSAPAFRSDAFQEIVGIACPVVHELLVPHRPIVANFVNKPSGSGVVPVHQNWYVVDEERYRSVSVWIALVDCDDTNGTLQVLSGSHRDFREPRGMWAYEAFVGAEAAIHPRLESVDVPAGSAMILDDALVHYSAPNQSPDDRLAIQLIMVPDQAMSLFCQRLDSDEAGDHIRIWEVEKEFFFNFWHGDGDERFGRVVDEIRIPSGMIDRASFELRFQSGRPTT